MALETGTYISDLVITNPTSTDPKSEGDNHLRLIKSTLQATFPNITGAVTLTQDQLNSAGSVVGRNKIINGKMEIAQRGTSFAGANAVYTLDRWVVGFTGSAVATTSQQTDVPSTNEFQSSLRVAITTADASIAAGDNGFLSHRIEGYNVRDLIGRTFTLSFWVRSSKTGVHCVSLTNSGPDRTYVAEYTVNAGNTWEFKTITVSSGLITAGTWNWTTGTGTEFRFALAAGSTFQTTANSWQTGNFLATSSQVNCLDTIGNIFAITGVQLEVGSVATPFEHRPYGLELALCQRYYFRSFAGILDRNFGVGPATTTIAIAAHVLFPVPMRDAPSALEQTGTAGDYGWRGPSAGTSGSVPTFNSATKESARVVFAASGLTQGYCYEARSVTANSYLGFSAEL